LAMLLRAHARTEVATVPRILLVDDDPAWRNLYRMALESQFDLFEATDGHQALSVLGAVRPDVIVLDLRMPRMDGMDFIRRLSRRSPRPKVIICSGTFTEAERPDIPGVCLAAKTPDLKELWAALRTTRPGAAEVGAPARQAVAVEDGVWRD
jgi:DNA-binding response OmpR family regulator